MENELHVTEAKSQSELGATVASRRTAQCLSLAFVIILLFPAVWQIMAEARAGDLFHEFRPLAGGLSRARLRAFEEALDRSAVLRSSVQPWLQSLLTSAGGFGNEKVVLANDGWLYYAPGLAYVSGLPFLDGDFLRLRAKKMVDKEGENAPTPDPRGALFDLIEDCRRWDIHLVLCPIPDKAMLQPLPLNPGLAGVSTVPDNSSFAELSNELRARGGDVFDWRPRPAGPQEHLYLKHDTHWAPAFMEEYAARLAEHISTTVRGLPESGQARRYRLLTERRRSEGDLAAMLKMTNSRMHFSMEEVEIHPVFDDHTQAPAVLDRRSPILLLGDSFTNVYSLSSLNWGEHAGLAEHLMDQLNQPIDAIALNGEGATGTRRELIRAARDGHLNGKKVLIYEFAIRDLASENWLRLRLPDPPPVLMTSAPKGGTPPHLDGAGSAPQTPISSQHRGAGVAGETNGTTTSSLDAGTKPAAPTAAAAGLEIVGELTATSRVPEPGTAPYKDCVAIMKFNVSSVARGVLPDRTILVGFWAMRGDVWMDAASYKVGDSLRMTLIPFEAADSAARGTQRSDDLHDYDSPLFWATHAEVLRK